MKNVLFVEVVMLKANVVIVRYRVFGGSVKEGCEETFSIDRCNMCEKEDGWNESFKCYVFSK